MSDSSVPLNDVLIVLKAKGVSISALDKTKNTYLLVGNGWLEVSTFTERVGKRIYAILGVNLGLICISFGIRKCCSTHLVTIQIDK